MFESSTLCRDNLSREIGRRVPAFFAEHARRPHVNGQTRASNLMLLEYIIMLLHISIYYAWSSTMHY